VGEVVMAHELPDGRFNLVVRGRARVRLVEELISDEPYRLITARPFGDLKPPSAAELSDADQSLRALVGRLAESVPDGGELLRQVVAAQATPHELVDVLAAALIADAGKRQRLLETRDVVRRIETVSSEIVAMTGKIVSSDKAN
jgi:Lon protease-like protein